MSRAPLVCACLAAVGLAGLVGLGMADAAPVMPSYLSGWLVLLALPAGALPLVLGWEALGAPATPVLAWLRRLLCLMPLAALLALPILALAPRLSAGLSDTLGVAGTGWWVTPAAFILRAALVLVAWSLLALVFGRMPYRPRPRLALVGLLLHPLLGALAAADFVFAVDPGFRSSAGGLLVMTAQAGLALAAAVLLRGAPAPQEGRALALGLLATVLCWAFLAFTQFLVVWSANLPREAAWVLQRGAGLGHAAAIAAALICGLAIVGLSLPVLARRPDLLRGIAAALLLLHGGEMFWLVTPAFRSTVTLALADGLALAGFGGLAAAASLLLAGRLDAERLRDGPA